MTEEVNQRCPNGCEAGYIVRDGQNECVDCGSPMVDRSQSSLEGFDQP